MIRRRLYWLTALAHVALAAALAPMIGAAQLHEPSSTLKPQTEAVYGWDLMSPDEREAFRQSLQRAPTAQARDELRREQRRQMRLRAQWLDRALGDPHRMEINRPVSQQPAMLRDPAPGRS